jgi:ankyrin repeat protein
MCVYVGTPLHVAAMRGQALCASMLLEGHATVEARDAQRCTPLHHAAFGGARDIVLALIERGADPNTKGTQFF